MKKTLAILLSALIIIGASAPAFAAGRDNAFEALSYVALGDSSSNGYGLAGFDFNYSGRYSYVPEAYIWRFAELLREGGREVSFTNLTLCGMRPNELVYFLDPSTEYDELDAYAKQWYKYFAEIAYPDRETLFKTYSEAIKNADIITYDLGTNNFGNYMVARLAGIFGIDIGFDWKGYNDEHFNDLMAKYDVPISLELENSVTAIVEKATDGALTQDIMAQMADTLLFSYASFVVGFRDSINQIYALNSDAELIVAGLPNTLSGNVAKIAGVTIDLGVLYGSLIDLANEYIISLNEHCRDYRYADLRSGVENVIQALARGVIYDDLADDLFGLFYSGDMLGDRAPGFVGKLAYGTDGVKVYKKALSAAYRSPEATPEKAAADSIIGTFIKAARYSDPLDIEAGMPYVQNGLKGLDEVFISAFTDFDNASELAKGAVKLIMNLLENGTGAHPSAYGHEQKLNAVSAAHNTDIPANTTHSVRFISSVMDFIHRLFSASDRREAVRSFISELINSVFPVRFC